MKKILLPFIMVMLITIFQSTAFGEETISLSRDNLIISDSGIFILTPTVDSNLKKIAVSQLNSNESGLFIYEASISHEDITSLIRCPRNHVATCPRCFGCSSKNCPYRCRCE